MPMILRAAFCSWLLIKLYLLPAPHCQSMVGNTCTRRRQIAYIKGLLPQIGEALFVYLGYSHAIFIRFGPFTATNNGNCASEPLKIYLTAVRGVSNIVQSDNKVSVSSRSGTWRQLILASNLMDLVQGHPRKPLRFTTRISSTIQKLDLGATTSKAHGLPAQQIYMITAY